MVYIHHRYLLIALKHILSYLNKKPYINKRNRLVTGLLHH